MLDYVPTTVYNEDSQRETTQRHTNQTTLFLGGTTMLVNNKKVNEAIEKLEKITGNTYVLRTENTRPDLNYSAKYALYMVCCKDGFSMPGTFGSWNSGYKTQKEFIKFVDELEVNHQKMLEIEDELK